MFGAVDDLLQGVVGDFGPVVEREHGRADVGHFLLRRVEDEEPMRAIRQRDFQLTRREIDARAGDRFRGIANEHVRAQRIVHVVPRLLYEILVALTVEDLEVHDDHLVGVFDVDAKAQFLEHASLGLDHVVLEGDVVLVQYQRRYRATGANLARRKES